MLALRALEIVVHIAETGISGQQKKRLTGVGPAYLAWEASVLPMYYSRITNIFYGEYKNFSITICILMRYRSVQSVLSGISS